MGKKPIGEKALTEAGKQRWYRQKLSAARKAKIANEVKEWKKLKRALIDQVGGRQVYRVQEKAKRRQKVEKWFDLRKGLWF